VLGEKKSLYQYVTRLTTTERNRIMNKDKQEILDAIMDEFNFHSVHEVMEHLNWRWGLEDVPTVGELRKCARKLLKRVLTDKDVTFSATGGFRAQGNQEKDWARLSFELESWEADNEEDS
jgi:hypothetical protein